MGADVGELELVRAEDMEMRSGVPTALAVDPPASRPACLIPPSQSTNRGRRPVVARCHSRPGRSLAGASTNREENEVAHDRRTGGEPWAWLAAIPTETLDRDWHRVRERIAVTLQHQSTQPSQRVGDLVVYCGASTGVLAGVTEIVDAPRGARLRVIPRLVLDRTRAPSI